MNDVFDELSELDLEFQRRFADRSARPEDVREYWQRHGEIQERRTSEAVLASVSDAVKSVFGPRGVYAQDLGHGYYWLRPRSDKGLEYRLLKELEKKLPKGRTIVRLMEKHKGFVITIG